MILPEPSRRLSSSGSNLYWWFPVACRIFRNWPKISTWIRVMQRKKDRFQTQSRRLRGIWT